MSAIIIPKCIYSPFCKHINKCTQEIRELKEHYCKPMGLSKVNAYF